jgi:hypothetical protein
MSDPSGRPDGGHNANVEAGSEGDRGVPRWVKLFGIAAILLLALAIVVMLLSGGQHGPGRHLSSLGVASTSSPLSAVDPAHTGAAS